jgi:hypothetical protein
MYSVQYGKRTIEYSIVGEKKVLNRLYQCRKKALCNPSKGKPISVEQAKLILKKSQMDFR